MLRNGWDIAPKPLSHWADAVLLLLLFFPLFFILYSPLDNTYDTYLEAID